MTDSPLHDPVVQRAVSGVQLRSERQEDVEQLVTTFVDPGISVQLNNQNNQIIYGRRGTGKTHVLKVVQAAADQEGNGLSLYIDMRTLGSSSIFNDEGRPLHVRVASLLRDVLAHVETALLEWATDPSHEVAGPVFEALNDLSSAVTRTALAEVERQEGEENARERRAYGREGIELSTRPAVSLTTSTEQNAQGGRPHRTQGPRD